MVLKGRFSLITSTAPPRSSHSLVALRDKRVFQFGGEQRPREPADTDAGAAWLLQLNGSNNEVAAPLKAEESAEGPIPRVGTATATIGNAVWMWGGRGGKEMAPLAGKDAGWWKAVTDSDGAAVRWQHVVATNVEHAPANRSYHTIAAIGDTLYVHAGCPETGRLEDLHSFDTTTLTWKQCAPAPPPGCGGTFLAAVHVSDHEEAQLARWGGFAGYELGEDNALHLYSPSNNSWSTVHPAISPSGGMPGPRSVHALLPLRSPTDSSIRLVMFFGERDASALGHAGAGKFWNDVWALRTKSGGEWQWEEVEVEGERPEERGWFGACTVGPNEAVIGGGLLSSNERSTEVWKFQLE